MKINLLLLGVSGCLITALASPLAGWGLGTSKARSLTPHSDNFVAIGGEIPVRSPVDTRTAQASATVPVQEILANLKGKTKVAIFLPSQLPFSKQVYFNSEGTANGYTVSINYTPNCRGTACSLGEIRAEKGGELMTPLSGVTKTFKTLQLAQGMKGIFHNGCGAYCTATVEWKSQGVLYSIGLKNGREAETIAIANSAIQAGPR